MSASSRVPLWRQVLDDLEQRLADGEIGDRFPTDRELVEHYDVSRHTVREAVRHLKARGVIERERGRGSHVASAEFVQPAGALYSLFSAVEDQGREQTSQVLRLQSSRDAQAASQLGVSADVEFVCLERLRLADDEPLALDTAWLPADLARPLLEADFAHTSLYEELEARTGIRPARGEEHIAPVAPTRELRQSLDLRRGEGVLRLHRVSWAGDQPVECRVTLIRGRRFSLVSRWPDGAMVRARFGDD